MRELDVRVELPCAPAVALRTIYDDAGAFFAEYHRTVSKDAGASVSSWDGSRTRTVSFLKRLDMPAALAKVLGACQRERSPHLAVGRAAVCALAARANAARRRDAALMLMLIVLAAAQATSQAWQ
jgi:hypothetical protein